MDIEFPMTLKDIPKFERLNVVSINVYGIENGQVLTLWFTDDKKEKHVNLLYLEIHATIALDTLRGLKTCRVL